MNPLPGSYRRATQEWDTWFQSWKQRSWADNLAQLDPYWLWILLPTYKILHSIKCHTKSGHSNNLSVPTGCKGTVYTHVPMRKHTFTKTIIRLLVIGDPPASGLLRMYNRYSGIAGLCWNTHRFNNGTLKISFQDNTLTWPMLYGPCMIVPHKWTKICWLATAN